MVRFTDRHSDGCHCLHVHVCRCSHVLGLQCHMLFELMCLPSIIHYASTMRCLMVYLSIPTVTNREEFIAVAKIPF